MGETKVCDPQDSSPMDASSPADILRRDFSQASDPSTRLLPHIKSLAAAQT